MRKDNFLDCPACGEHVIDRAKTAISVFRIFYYPKCKKCGRKYYVGKSWQENILGGLIIFIFIAAYLSQKYNAYIIYLIPLFWVLIGCLSAYFFAKPVLIEKIAGSNRIINSLLYIIVFCFVAYYLFQLSK